MDNYRVLILSGGTDPENKVSLISARAIKEGVIKNHYKADIFDIKNGYNELKEIAKNYDVLFPVIHGREGEGGQLHSFLKKLKKPIVGTTNIRGLKTGFYKINLKKYCVKKGINTPKWKIVNSKKDIINFGFPCVLKCSDIGSSLGVCILNKITDLNKSSTQRLFSYNSSLYVEEFLIGKDITVGIFNSKPLPVIEVVAPEGKWLDFKTKYSGLTKDIPYAPSVDDKVQKLAQKITLQIHTDLCLGDLSRADYKLVGDSLYLLEFNLIPGLTPISAFPQSAKCIGLDYEQLTKELIFLAVDRFNKVNL